MGSKTSIGIYISAGDKDIAAWFNLLARNNMSRSKWVRGLLAAYSLGEPLRIGMIDKKAPLINDPDNPRDTVPTKGSFKYGWHIRGPNHEFVIGSVVNLSICNDEIKETLDEAWANGHMLAPFIKSLIRKNLKTGDREAPPKLEDLNWIWSEYLISVNGQATKRKRKELMAGSPQASEAAYADRVINRTVKRETEDRGKEVTTPVPKSDRAFTFVEETAPASAAPRATATQTSSERIPEKKSSLSSLGKNPLLSQI